MVNPLFILIPLMFLPLIYSFLCFDKLVKYQHDHHHQEWLKEGGTDGIWIPSVQSFVGSLARNLFMFTLLFSSRPWIETNADLRKTRRRYQISVAMYLLLFIAYSSAILYSSITPEITREKKQDQKNLPSPVGWVATHHA